MIVNVALKIEPNKSEFGGRGNLINLTLGGWGKGGGVL